MNALLDTPIATERVNASPAISLLDGTEIPLSRSPLLLQSSRRMLEWSHLYGFAPLRRTVGETTWRFQWLYSSRPMSGTELRLRIGGAPVSIGLDDLRPFGCAGDLMRPELSAELRTAYLIGCGAALWKELESLTHRTVELVEVRPHCVFEITPECLGFELEQEPRAVVVRGLVRSQDARLHQILLEAGRREMLRAQPRRDVCIQWTAVLGSTSLPIREVRALEEHDVVVIDDAHHTPEALECWLGAGPARRFAGRGSLCGGWLHVIDFTLKGNASMAEHAGEPPENVGIDDIPVSLRFEVAQWHATLSEVSALAPGTIIDLGQRVDAQSVTVWVGQRCIGRGELVAIGERLGVRLLSIFQGQSPAAVLTSAGASAQSA